MPTIRKRMTEALEKDCLDLREISQRFGIREREALEHLEHVARSAHPKKFIIEPALCRNCGFSFRKRARLGTPGRCPLCRSESITPPRFSITG